MTVLNVILFVVGVLFGYAAVSLGTYLVRLFAAIDELTKD